MDYKNKYLKYKTKYLKLRGGSGFQGYTSQNASNCFVIPESATVYQKQQMIIQQLQQQLNHCQYMYNQQQAAYENKLNEQMIFYENELQKSKYSKMDSSKVDKPRKNALLIEEPHEKTEKLTHKEALEYIDKLEKDLDDLTKSNNYLNSSLRIQQEETEHLEQALLKILDEDTIQKIKRHKRTMINDIRQPFFPLSGPFLYNKKIKHIENEMTEYKAHPEIYTKYKYDTKRIEEHDLDYKPSKKSTSAETSSDTKKKVLDTPSTQDVLIKNFISFLNTSGGRLYFGISDNLVVHGIKNINSLKHAEHVQIRITELLEEKVKAYNIAEDKLRSVTPDFILFIWHTVYNHDLAKDIYILEIQVQKGSDEFIYMTTTHDIYYRGAATTKQFDKTTSIDIIKQRLDTLKSSSKTIPNELEYLDETDEDYKKLLKAEEEELEETIEKVFNSDIHLEPGSDTEFETRVSAAPEEVAPAEEEDNPAEEEDNPAEEEDKLD